uniref:Uncharacterized protein n=1 Tax=Chromera velia CCMP2878 TaxID=1169474 RepID=A0A0G4HDG9_9ALVE|eukprot:Cvel_26373.t1-p1 / transcript=Cvel_26373.t1 / gene=Cvel_26373 / organism=Chromera_velia_CCMP2878 / gene_product=hypothetical protein / transcript_product=hypothetical protein / location=Cvel_scaffold3125:6851-8218(+) / protein_length=456 / sequence_SO=supercontig / SO=protein_coding / is_pseudo=false
MNAFSAINDVASSDRVGLKFSDRLLGIRFWKYVPDDIRKLAASWGTKQVDGKDRLVRSSFTFQKEFIADILGRFDSMDRINRNVWIPSVTFGVLSVSNGTTTKTFTVPTSPNISMPNGLEAAIAETACLLDTTQLNLHQVLEETVYKLENFSKKYRGWQINKDKKKGRYCAGFQGDHQRGGGQISSSSSSGGSGSQQRKGGKSFSSARFAEAVADTYLKMTGGKENKKGKKKKHSQQRVRRAHAGDGDTEDDEEEEDEDGTVEDSQAADFDKEQFITRFSHCIELGERDSDGFNTSYERARMAFVLSEDSGEEVAFRLNTDNGIKLYMDTECSFSLFPLSEVSECIVYRWPHRSVYTEAFGAREGGGVICNERAIIEVRIPLAAGYESVVRLIGNLTDHPGAKNMLLSTPQICHLSGYAAIVTSNRDIVKAKLTSASPNADFPFTTSVLAQKVSGF